MKKSLLTVLVISLMVITAKADFFPVNMGSGWRFDYTTVVSSWGSTTIDSGYVSWEVLSIVMTMSIPAQEIITIEQVRSLRRTVRDSSWNSEALDTIYDPMKLTIDTLVLKNTEGETGLFFENDTAFKLVHDTAGVKCSVVVVEALGTQLNAVRLLLSGTTQKDSGTISIPDIFSIPEYFTLADGIGPVAYHLGSSPFISDYYYSENWYLTDTLSSATPISSGVKGLAKGGASSSYAGGILSLNVASGQMVELKAFLSNGKEINKMSLKKHFNAGLHRIDLNTEDIGHTMLFVQVKGRDILEVVKLNLK